jgi:uncharacterized protein
VGRVQIEKEKSMSDSSAKVTALVTGGSRDIGVIYADRLAKRGYNLILVGRSETQRRTLSARLTKETGRSVTPLITMLVNNAGIGSITPLLNTEVDKTERIALLITALTRLTYAAPPAFVARSAGTIINIASVVGISPETLNGVYGATKAYVVAFSLSLQHELADKGIRIQAELPGVTATDLWEIAGLPWQKLPASIVMSPEDMVDAALVGLDQGELVTIPGLHDGDEWTHFEAARRALSQRFGNSTPAPRYGIGLPQSA